MTLLSKYHDGEDENPSVSDNINNWEKVHETVPLTGDTENGLGQRPSLEGTNSLVKEEKPLPCHP